jgi:hypothetical protein
VILGFRRCVDEIALFWDIGQRVVVILYIRFGTHTMGPIFKGQKVKKNFLVFRLNFYSVSN